MNEVSIIGATFYGNRGAEAMLSTTIGEIREASGDRVVFNVFSYYPVRDRELVNDPDVVMHSATPLYLVTVLIPGALLFQLFRMLRLSPLLDWLPSSVSALSRSRVLICLAGVSFVEGRTKFLPFNIATIFGALVLAVPVVKFAQAVGPFKALLNRLCARAFLGRCRKIFGRGEQTQLYLEQLFGDSDISERADDIAFLFKSEYSLSVGASGLNDSLALLEAHRGGGKLVVGLCPSIVVAKSAESRGWNYARAIGEIIAGLVEKGFVVALFPNATRAADMNKSHNNDLPLLQEIADGLPEELRKSVVSFTGALNAENILRIIHASDVLVVSRFHAMVASLAAAKPVMVIGWSHKYVEVMDSFGQQDMVIDYAQSEVGPVLDSVDRLVAERADRSERISQSLPSVRSLSAVQIEYVVKLLQV